jgi:hypothetical protein
LLPGAAVGPGRGRTGTASRKRSLNWPINRKPFRVER